MIRREWSRADLLHLPPEQLIDLVLQLQDDRALHGSATQPASDDDPSETRPRPVTADGLHKRLMLLSAVAVALNEPADEAAIIDRVLETVHSVLHLRRALVLLWNKEQRLELARLITADQPIHTPEPEVVNLAVRRGLSGWVWRYQRSIVVPDVAHEPQWEEIWNIRQPGSACAVPLRQGRSVRGVLVMYHARANTFSRADLLWLEGIAALINVTLAATEQRVDERMRRDHLLALLGTANYVSAERSPDELAQMVQSRSAQMFGVDYGLLFLADDDATLHTVSPLPAQSLSVQDTPQVQTRAREIALLAWRRNVPIAPQADEQQSLPFAFIGLPLTHSGQAIGALVLVYSTARPLVMAASVWSMLTVFTSFVAATCYNVQLVQQLRHRRDVLEAEVRERTRQLQDSRDTLRAVFDNDPSGILFLDTNERITASNITFCNWFVGQHPRALIGLAYDQLWKQLVRSDLRVTLHRLLPASSPHAAAKGAGAAEDVTRSIFRVHRRSQQSWYLVMRHAVYEDQTVTGYVERWENISSRDDLPSLLLWHDQTALLNDALRQTLHEAGRVLAAAVPAGQGRQAALPYRTATLDQLQQLETTIATVQRMLTVPIAQWRTADLNAVLRVTAERSTEHVAVGDGQLILMLDDTLPAFLLDSDTLAGALTTFTHCLADCMAAGERLEIATRWLAFNYVCRVTFRTVAPRASLAQLTAWFGNWRTPAHPVPPAMVIAHQVVQRHAGEVTLQVEPLSDAPTQRVALQVELPFVLDEIG